MKFVLSACFLVLSMGVLAKGEEKSIQLLKNPRMSKVDLMDLGRLDHLFMMPPKTSGLTAMLKANALKHKHKAVPVLIKVMKESRYPDQNRWQATMLLGQIMGKKAAPFIAKFATHPNWMMRLASLKALLALDQKEYVGVYSKALRDPSLIVRVQALDNISRMQIKSLGPNIWSMMYDQSNYSGNVGNRKRTSIVKSVIRTLGDLQYDKAKKPMALLIQKPKYRDLADDLDYSLEKITGKSSPNELDKRRKFWSNLVVKESTI